MYFIAILAIVGAIACLAMLRQFMESGTPPYTIFLKMCTNILHLAPPALPIMTAFCLTTSLARLRLSNIFGVNPNAILNAGRVTTCCFDKTGTLTEFHMDFYQFIISKGKTFQEPIFVKEHKENKDLCKKLFATCHSITTNSKGEQLGDPLDIRMFEASGYTLKEAENANVTAVLDDLTLEVLYSYPFSSNDQCMSVIVKDPTAEAGLCYAFVKGSPEKIMSMSKPETVPENFEHVLRKYTMQGLRVLAMGYRTISLESYQKMKRQQVESEMNFIGLMIFQNFLKHDTVEVLTRLRKANFKLKMISGDNSLTCVSAGKEASIVPKELNFVIMELSNELQVTVSEIQEEQLVEIDSFDLQENEVSIEQWIKDSTYFKEKEIIMHGAVLESLLTKSDEIMVLKLIERTALFGRCRPEHKAMVIRALKKLGVVCAMVGDGANDCPAIKAADLGISFSTADGSISAPFSALSPSISCIEKIILEGKCTSQNSIDNVKYYATTGMYKVVINLIIVFEHCYMSQMQNVFASYVAGTQLFNILFGISSPVQEITLLYPDDNLLSCRSLGLVITYEIMVHSNFYEYSHAKYGKLCDKSMASTVMMNYLYIISISTLLSMYVAKPFRQPLYKNYILTPLLLGKLIYCIVMIFDTRYSMPDLKEVGYSMWFVAVILGIWIFMFIFQYAIDYWFQQRGLRVLAKELEIKQKVKFD